MRWSGVHRVEHPNCSTEETPFERDGSPGVRTVLHTPAGDLHQERLRNPGGNVWRTTERYVKEPADYEPLMAYFRDAVVVEDLTRASCARSRSWARTASPSSASHARPSSSSGSSGWTSRRSATTWPTGRTW